MAPTYAQPKQQNRNKAYIQNRKPWLIWFFHSACEKAVRETDQIWGTMVHLRYSSETNWPNLRHNGAPKVQQNYHTWDMKEGTFQAVLQLMLKI